MVLISNNAKVRKNMISCLIRKAEGYSDERYIKILRAMFILNRTLPNYLSTPTDRNKSRFVGSCYNEKLFEDLLRKQFGIPSERKLWLVGDAEFKDYPVTSKCCRRTKMQWDWYNKNISLITPKGKSK